MAGKLAALKQNGFDNEAPLTAVRETSPMKHENEVHLHDDVRHEVDDLDEPDGEDDSGLSQSSSYISCRFCG